MLISELKFGHLILDNESFPIDEVFTDVNAAYSDFTFKLISVIKY